MVHSNRQARSVSGSRSLASDGFLAPDATGTQNSHLQTKSPSSHTKPKPISAYFLPNLPLAISTTTASIAGCNELSGDAARSLPIDAGRPPSRILDSGSGALQEHINGVVTGVELIKDDVAALADASATTFDRAITKNAAPPTKDKDKRVLRSQDNSSRPRSNLARFFPDFEEVVFGTPTEPEPLTASSVLYVFENKPKTRPTTQEFPLQPSLREIGSDLREGLAHDDARKLPLPSNANRMDFAPFEKEALACKSDPLADSVYVHAHKRGERKEKQMRNIEKEHALHEKSDLERLLEELKGPDWLRTMGVLGVSDAEKKRYEEFRNQYIERAKALLNKFTLWKEQERELKLRREEALLAKEEAVDDEDDDKVEDTQGHSRDLVDASARQLQLEATSALNTSLKAHARVATKLYLPAPEPEPIDPFVSFYAQPDIRAAAMGGHSAGRTVTAFGQPIPDLEEQEFELPEGYVTEEMVIANARKRRRMKRESAANASEPRKRL